MPAVSLASLGYTFRDGAAAVKEVSLDLAAGEFFCLLGASGSGKSTLLRLIGGYLLPETGSVRIHGRDVTHEPPELRNTGMVFQNYALFPHLNALDNVAFGLRTRGVPRAERERKAHEMLDWVGLTKEERGRRPNALSGGQQQRVALARALAFGPSLLMLDEPFANLDRALRERLREEMRAVQRRAGITAILVTHDRDEAFALGDRIAIMHEGRLLQTGTPEEMYHRPGSATVAGFLGHRNVYALEKGAGNRVQAAGLPKVPLPDPAVAGGSLLLWPDRLVLSSPAGANVTGVVSRAVLAAGHRSFLVKLDSGAQVEVHAPHDGPVLTEGELVGVTIPERAMTLIPSSSS